MSRASGFIQPLSLPRRLICDLMDCSRQVPLVSVQRRMGLELVARARALAQPRPGWSALIVKAYAQVAAHRPELRRCYCAFPWPHLYEHAENVASVAVERAVGTEGAVMFGQIRSPERMPLDQIDAQLHRYKENPLESIGQYRRLMRVAALPRPLRRLLWWHAYQSSGRRRAYYLGTFGLTTLTGLGGSVHTMLSPLTSTLTFGKLEADGTMTVTLNFDHRVFDGGSGARALSEMEQVLRCEILAELRYLQGLAAA